MALPLAISGISTAIPIVGPFQSSGGNYYFFGRDATTPGTLQAFKATDPTSSWSSIATSTGYATAVQFLAGYQVGDTIHLAVCSGSGTSVNIHYQTFSMSTDAFVLKELVQASFNPQTNAAANAYGCSIVYRTSDSQPIILYNGAQGAAMGSSWARIVYSRRTGTATWAAAVAVDAGGTVDYTMPEAIIDGSSNSYFYFKQAATNLAAKQLNSSNVLNTWTGGSATSGTFLFQAIWDGNADFLWSDKWNTTSSGSSSSAQIDSTADIARPFYDSGGTTKYYALYRSSTDSDIYVVSSTSPSLSWSGKTSSLAGTVSAADSSLSIDGAIYQRGSAVVIPYFVNDNGTIKYNEYTVRTTGVSGTASITEASDTVSSASTIALKGTASITEADDTVSSASTIVKSTLDPNTVTSGFTLSNGNLTATLNSTGNQNVRSTTSRASTKTYVEFTVGATSSNKIALGISNETILTTSNFPGDNANSFGLFDNGSGSINGTFPNWGFMPISAGDVVSMAYDPVAKLVWYRINGGNWNASGTANPATGVGGADVSALTGTARYVAVYAAVTTGIAITVNFGYTGFTYAVPSGFSNWEPAGPISGTASITEAADTVASTSTVAIKGTSSITEADDTVASASTIAIKANSSITEAGDTVASTSTVLIKATESSTEADDTVASTATILVKGTASITEADDTVSATSTVAIKAASSITEADDTVSSASKVALKASASITEADDTASSIGLSAVAFTDNFNRANSVLESSALMSNGLSSWQKNGSIGGGAQIVTNQLSNMTSDATGDHYYYDLQQTNQWVSFKLLDTTGNSFVTLRADATVSTNYIGVRASGSNFQIWKVVAGSFTNLYNTNQSVVSGDVFDVRIWGTDNIRVLKNGTQIVSMNLGVTLTGTKVGVHVRQAVQNPLLDDFSGAWAVQATSAITEADDTVSATGTVSSGVSGTASITEADDTVSSTSTVLIKASSSVTEAGDTVSSTSTVLIKASASVTEADDTISSAAKLPIKANNPKGFYVTNSGDNGFNWSGSAYVVPDGSLIIAGAYDYPWTSSDKGITWTQQTGLSSISIGQSYLFGSNYDGSILIAPLSFGDIYKSIDRGVTWTTTSALASAELSGNWQAIGMSNDGSVIIAGERNGTTAAHPVISYNQGSTWASLTAAGSRAWVDFALSSDGSTIYGLTLTGLWKSTNSGSSWTQITTIPSPGPNGNSAYKDIDCSVDGQIIAITARSSTTPVTDTYLYSTNGGTSWTSKTINSPSEFHYVTLSDDGSIQYVSGGDGSTFAAIYKSTDHFTTYSVITPASTYSGQYWEISCSADGTFLASLDYNDYNITAYDGSTPIIVEQNDTVSSTSTIAIKASVSITEGADTLSASSTLLSAISGTASITEADDTVSSASTITIKAAASITEAGDTVSSTATIAIKASASITESSDTVSSTGTVAVKAAASITETDDTVSATGFSTNRATASITEADDSVSSTSTVTIKAAASITETDDTVSSTGTSAIKGSASITEADDTLSSASSLLVRATASITEADDSVSSTSTVAVKATASITESDDTLSGTGFSTNRAAVAITEANDVVSGTGTILLTGSSSITEAGDTLSATGFSTNRASAAITESDDTVSAASKISISAVGNITEAADTVSSTGTSSIKASASITEDDDTLVAGSNGIHLGVSDITEADDTSSATATLSIKASASITEADDTLSGTGFSTNRASAAITEAADTVSSTSTIAIKANSSITETNDTSSSTGALAIKASAAITEGDDTLSSVNTSNTTAQLAVTEDNDNISAAAKISIAASASVTEQDDTLVAATMIMISALASMFEADDTMIATGVKSTHAYLSVTEGDDDIATTGTLRIAANSNIHEEDDTSVATGSRSSRTATLNVHEQDDVCHATITVSVKLYFKYDDYLTNFVRANETRGYSKNTNTTIGPVGNVTNPNENNDLSYDKYLNNFIKR